MVYVLIAQVPLHTTGEDFVCWVVLLVEQMICFASQRTLKQVNQTAGATWYLHLPYSRKDPLYRYVFWPDPQGTNDGHDWPFFLIQDCGGFFGR